MIMDNSTKAQINKLEGNKPKFFSESNQQEEWISRKEKGSSKMENIENEKKANLQIFSTIDLKISKTGPFALVSTNWEFRANDRQLEILSSSVKRISYVSVNIWESHN